MRAAVRYLVSNSGASSAEFALVLIPFTALVLSIITAMFLFYTQVTLQYATEAAARCWEVEDSVANAPCTDSAGAITFAGQHYYGLAPAKFSHPSSTCGHNIQGEIGGNSGTSAFPVDIGILNTAVDMKANACFP